MIFFFNKSWIYDITDFYDFQPHSIKFILLFQDELFELFEYEKYGKFNFNFNEEGINNKKVELVEIERISEFKGTFWQCKNLIKLQIEWDIITFERDMFYNCTSLISLDFSKCIKVILKNDCSRFFYNCSSLKYLSDMSQWNIDEANDISYFFSGCSSLISLPGL